MLLNSRLLMKPVSSFVLLSAAFLAACGTPATVATTVPSPKPTATTTTATTTTSTTTATPAFNRPTIVPAVNLVEAPKDWQLMDEAMDHVPGVSANRAISELLADRKPARTVLVAIIDNGIDTAHVDLKANLWSNPKEIGGNHKDDDNNGFVDDVHGWNFIGSATGEDVNFDTFEVTREYARCHGKAAAGGAPPITDADLCKKVDAAFLKQQAESQGTVENLRGAKDALTQVTQMLQRALGTDSLTITRVQAFNTSDPQLQRAQRVFVGLVSQGATLPVLTEQLQSAEGQLKYGLNPDFDSRKIVGDHYADVSERHYGNPDVEGPSPLHGTHVAGIIGAVRKNGVGVDGIAPSVKFMMIRTVPDGDERDKDVANAIRYATDNGAQIISMSFGKGYSPFKSAVDDAVKYADSKGVLMIHAAGNDGADVSKEKNYPTPIYLDGGRAKNWIEVGASSWRGGDNLAANFSNYGRNEVDIFAPGVDILSTLPDNKYGRESGTSMAAPVVSGVAALLMAYFPKLDAADVRKILLESAARHPDQRVKRPGEDGGMTTFGTLSVTGGIVNAYNAVKMAEQMSAAKK